MIVNAAREYLSEQDVPDDELEDTIVGAFTGNKRDGLTIMGIIGLSLLSGVTNSLIKKPMARNQAFKWTK